jgi:hypothetical protein
MMPGLSNIEFAERISHRRDAEARRGREDRINKINRINLSENNPENPVHPVLNDLDLPQALIDRSARAAKKEIIQALRQISRSHSRALIPSKE